MDQFEAAKLKAQKRAEQRARYAIPKETREMPEQKPVAWVEPVVPKEKDKSFQAAIIEVKVRLPNGDFGFSLLKHAVLQNANPSKLTRGQFLNCIVTGLEPLLGRVKEI